MGKKIRAKNARIISRAKSILILMSFLRKIWPTAVSEFTLWYPSSPVHQTDHRNHRGGRPCYVAPPHLASRLRRHRRAFWEIRRGNHDCRTEMYGRCLAFGEAVILRSVLVVEIG